MDLQKLVGQEVTVQGTAFDAHAGAVVVTSDGAEIYVGGLGYWHKQDRGRSVEVTGTLRVQKLAPDPTEGPGGVATHGMFGSELVLEGATWRVLPEST